VSMAMPAAQNSVLNAVAGSEIGKASGVFNMLRYLGGVFGIAILAPCLRTPATFTLPRLSAKGFAVAIGAATGLSVVAAIAGMWLPRGAMVPASAVASGATRDTKRPSDEPSLSALRIEQQSSAA